MRKTLATICSKYSPTDSKLHTDFCVLDDWKIVNHPTVHLPDGTLLENPESVIRTSRIVPRFEIIWKTRDEADCRTFYLFPRLPLELRRQIWTEILPEFRFLVVQPQPMLHVGPIQPFLTDRRRDLAAFDFKILCKDLRDLYLEAYTNFDVYGMIGTWNHPNYPGQKAWYPAYPDSGGEELPIYQIVSKDFASFRRDTVYINNDAIKYLEHNFHWLDLSSLEHLALETKWYGNRDRGDELRHLWEYARQCGRLKKLTIIPGRVGYWDDIDHTLVEVNEDYYDMALRTARVQDGSHYGRRGMLPDERDALIHSRLCEARQIKCELELYARQDSQNRKGLVITVAMWCEFYSEAEPAYYIPTNPTYHGVIYSGPRCIDGRVYEKRWVRITDLDAEAPLRRDGTVEGLYDGIPDMFEEE